MGEVITFVGYRPPARYDSLPWTNARVEEASAVDGVFTQIDTFVLSPTDLDPVNPQARSFTTENGTASGYWYRVVFVDGTGDTSQPTTPVQNLPGSDVAPHAYATVNQLAALLNLAVPTVAQTEGMQRVLNAAAAEIDWELAFTVAAPAPVPPPPLVVQVNLARAVELWKEAWTGFGIVPLGPDVVPVVTARDSWHRHARTLAPLKTQWGIS